MKPGEPGCDLSFPMVEEVLNYMHFLYLLKRSPVSFCSLYGSLYTAGGNLLWMNMDE